MSDPFYRPPAGWPTFHGRVSTNRSDEGFRNYLSLTANNYRMRVYLDGEQREEVITADPDAGTIEIYYGTQVVTLKGHVEIRLERKPPS